MTALIALGEADIGEFQPFAKIPRLNRGMVLTEKLDGTNAQVWVGEDGSIRAGSRTRWITPGADNFGFAAWVESNRDQLLELGPGRHYGEWYGAGIQRRYGLAEKRFALFNSKRWAAARPACCEVVPVLYEGPFSSVVIDEWVERLRMQGSVAVPGFMKPEGLIVFHVASGTQWKVTCEGDEKPKGSNESEAERP